MALIHMRVGEGSLLEGISSFIEILSGTAWSGGASGGLRYGTRGGPVALIHIRLLNFEFILKIKHKNEDRRSTKFDEFRILKWPQKRMWRYYSCEEKAIYGRGLVIKL